LDIKNRTNGSLSEVKYSPRGLVRNVGGYHGILGLWVGISGASGSGSRIRGLSVCNLENFRAIQIVGRGKWEKKKGPLTQSFVRAGGVVSD